jgi:hypothetical protein
MTIIMNDRKRINYSQPNERTKPINILILQGSPRGNGNTAWMAEEYRKAAEAAGGAEGSKLNAANLSRLREGSPVS